MIFGGKHNATRAGCLRIIEVTTSTYEELGRVGAPTTDMEEVIPSFFIMKRLILAKMRQEIVIYGLRKQSMWKI